MTIHVIFLSNSYEDGPDTIVGYVDSNEAAEKFCDQGGHRKRYENESKLFSEYHKRRDKWMAENKHRFVDVNMIGMYIEKKDRLEKKLESMLLSDLSRIPVDRHALVIQNYNSKKQPLLKELEDVVQKIKHSLNNKEAEKINSDLLAEMESVIGKEVTMPSLLNNYYYEPVEKIEA